MIERDQAVAQIAILRDCELLATADLLEDLLADNDQLRARQQELLQTCVRLTNEVPFPDEIKDWTSQRAKLIAEIGTLRAENQELRESTSSFIQEMRGVMDQIRKEIDTAPDRVPCDLCNRVAVWRHPAGGFRCLHCPRPNK